MDIDQNAVIHFRAGLQHNEVHPSISVQQHLDAAWEALAYDLTRGSAYLPAQCLAWSLWATKLGEIPAL